VAIDAPAVPETWRPPREVEHQLPVRDIGGGLAPVGAPAFLGRESERDAVWRALRGASTGGLRLCFVEGAAGVGKSAFVEWVTRRAHALGVARPLRITHERVRTPECGVAAMLRRTLRAGGLSGEALRAHLRPRLLELDVESDLEALCAWLEPDAETDTTASSRIAALARWIAARAVERPVCLVADDVDRSAETQRALVHLARTQPEAPILVLAVRTADGSAGGHRGTDTALDFVPGDRISLGPLEGGTLADVFGSALPLEEAALSALVAAADGNPWLGRMLYLHWLEEGRLHPTAEGYALAETGRPTLPTQVRSLWSERLRWACDGDPAQLACLELAATLGHEVDHVEWTRLCWSAGLEPSSATTCRLIEGDLIDIGRDERWRFAHPVVRSALRQQARDGGRAATWHGLVADALLGRSVIDSAEIGRHLLDAERPSEAAPHLARACRRALRWDEYAEARRAALSWARALRRARVPRGDEAWDRVALAWSESLRAEGEAERATRHAARAVRRAERRPVSRLLVEALQACALGRKWDLSHREQTLALARRAEAAATRLGADSLRARSAARLGVLLHTYGELADAEAAFRRAKSAGAATDSRRLRAEISLGLARVLIEHSDVVTAAVELEGALALARDAKAASLVAEVLTTLGDVARSRGAFDEAERRYSAALVVFEDTGAFASGWAGWANLALLALDRNQPAAAAPPLQRAREIALSIRNAAAMDMLASVGLSLAAADGAWAQFDATLSDLLGRTDHRYAQLDSARALFALERELAATDPLRAGGVAALRRAQQQALGLADSALGVPEVSNGR
jgi:tetratricopeptide (TPR) repeat protein